MALSFIAALILLANASSAGASGDKAAGDRLAVFLDGLQVESRWPASVHVDWETGLPDGKMENFEGKDTHCSNRSTDKSGHIAIVRPSGETRDAVLN